MQNYLQEHHEHAIYTILNASDLNEIPFRALNIDLTLLNQTKPELFERLNTRLNIWKEKPKWISALNDAQDAMMKSLLNNSIGEYYTVKSNFPVGFTNLPNTDNRFPHFKNLWSLVQLKGTILKSKERGMKEVTIEYKCRKCKQTMLIHADRLTQFYFKIPYHCTHAGCNGTIYCNDDPNNEEINMKRLIDYQEVTIQIFNKPNKSLMTILVELDEELMESCEVGDRVTICGTFESRSAHRRNDIHNYVLRAASVCVHETQQKMNMDPGELALSARMEYEEALAKNDGDEMRLRDEMVGSVAPELNGLSLVKLGLLLVLCSGGRKPPHAANVESQKLSERERELSHFLMIGDPGVGKSQLLKAASQISVNAIRSVGYAATAAGLTAYCFREGGDSHIEAGSLVKANNGVCCIDEINYMSKEHRASLHEAMESERITIAKGEFRMHIVA
jgi:DNA replicative helicase MCM subunit Mcm2 (Cdc46/Mcm family)